MSEKASTVNRDGCKQPLREGYGAFILKNGNPIRVAVWFIYYFSDTREASPCEPR